VIIEQKKIAILAKNRQERGEFICFKLFCQLLITQILAVPMRDKDSGLRVYQLKCA